MYSPLDRTYTSTESERAAVGYSMMVRQVCLRFIDICKNWLGGGG